MMKVVSIDPESPLFGYVRPGYKVKSVNGQEILDVIDFRYKLAEEEMTHKQRCQAQYNKLIEWGG